MQQDLFDLEAESASERLGEGTPLPLQLTLAHVRDDTPMGSCAWAWVLWGSSMRQGMVCEGAGGSLVSSPAQPGLWALDDALTQLAGAAPVELTTDCVSLQSGILLGNVRRTAGFRTPDGQWIADALRWQRALDLLEFTDVRSLAVRSIGGHPVNIQRRLQALLARGRALALERDTAPF